MSAREARPRGDLDFDQSRWKDRPKLLLTLSIGYADGTSQTIVSDTSGRLRREAMAPMRVTQTLPAVKLTEIRPGVWLYDFGETIAGWARIRVGSPAGHEVRLRFGELLRDGRIDRELGGLIWSGWFQQDRYVLKVTGVEEWGRLAFHFPEAVSHSLAPTTSRRGDHLRLIPDRRSCSFGTDRFGHASRGCCSLRSRSQSPGQPAARNRERNSSGPAGRPVPRQCHRQRSPRRRTSPRQRNPPSGPGSWCFRAAGMAVWRWATRLPTGGSRTGPQAVQRKTGVEAESAHVPLAHGR